MNVFNQRVRAVLRREYLQRVRNKWFLITTLLIPTLMIAGIGLTVWLTERTPTETELLRVGVVDRTGLGLAGHLTGRIGTDLEPPGSTARGTGSPPIGALGVRARAPVELSPAGVAPGLGPDDLGELLPRSPYDVFLYLPSDLSLSTAPPGDPVVPPGDTAARGPPTPTSGGSPPGGGREEGSRVRIISRSSVGAAHRRVIEAAVQKAAVLALLDRGSASSVNSDELLAASRLDADVLRADRTGAGSQEMLMGLGFGLGGLLYFMLLVYGSMIVRGVIEEKSSDIVEVLISSLRPWEMMLGKILGVGAVGLTQVAIWGVVIVGLVLYGLTAAAPALAQAGIELRLISVSLLPTLLAFLGFFLLGYLLYASLFAAVGALAGSEQDAQQVSLPVTILIIAAFLLLIPVMGAPEATWSIIVSQVPLFSPILMVARVSAGMAGAAETAVALLLLLLAVAGVVWLAGRIYRVGILMKGKRPSLRELVRWIRYG